MESQMSIDRDDFINMENRFYKEPRVMLYEDLVKAINHAEKHDYNRNINLESFRETIESFGYDPERLNYPVLPLIIHEHAQGKKVDPHIRIKVVGPLNESDSLVVEAILDCSFEVFNKLPIFDLENKKIVRAN